MRDGASRNSNSLVPGLLAGQRGDRFPESSPAGRHPVECQFDRHHYVQGEHPSHPFIQFLRDIAPVLALALFAAALGIGAAIVKALVFGA
jgi:hypothetical protein